MRSRASRTHLDILLDRLSHYRGWTLTSIEAAPQDWLYRRAGWTECTLGWHMGHLAWKQDSYAHLYCGLPQQLDADWQRRFYSAAPLDLAEAPSTAELRAVFDQALVHFTTAFADLTDAELARSDPTWPDGTLLGALVNVIMHEGEHLAGIDALVWSFTHRPDATELG